MNNKPHSQLLFLHPRDPQQSFSVFYHNETIQSIHQRLENDKQCFLLFTDVYGRPVPDNATEDYFKPLQPFYITSLAPKTINLQISLPRTDQQILCETHPTITASEVKSFIETNAQIPVGKQRIYLGRKLLSGDSRLLDHGLFKKDVEIRVVTELTLKIITDEKTFEITKDFDTSGQDFSNHFAEEMSYYYDPKFSFIINGKRRLNPFINLEANGIQSGDTIRFTKSISVQILDSNRYAEYFSPCSKIFEIKRFLVKNRNLILGGPFDLCLGNVILEDQKMLSDYSSGKLDIEISVKPKEGFVLVNCLNKKGGSFPSLPSFFMMKRNQSVADLKHLMLPCWFEKENCQVSFEGEKINDSQDLRDLLKPHENTLQLTLKLSWKGKRIFVKNLQGITWTCFAESSSPIESLKFQIEDLQGPGMNQQRLMFRGKQLEDQRTLSDYNIQEGDYLQLILRMLGGYGGIEFEERKPETRLWSKDAPAWRKVKEGLCLEGKCLNKSCEAFGQWVVINKGMGTYDLVADQHGNKCPICAENIKAEKFALNNCWYGYTGIKVLGGLKGQEKVTLQNEIKVGDLYKEFDPEIIEKASWLTLKIITKELEQDQVTKYDVDCGVCKEEVNMNGKGRLDCRHIFHNGCLQKIKNITPSSCAFCHL